MKTLKLHNYVMPGATLLENDFIDNHMVRANGEYVKVYLFLLRHLNNPCISLTISTIADCLENTEKDILRALKYWEKEGLLTIEYDASFEVTAICIGQKPQKENTPEDTLEEDLRKEDDSRTLKEPAEEAPAQTPEAFNSNALMSEPSSIEQFRNRKELKNLLFIAEKYLGKTLSHNDVETITYFYDTLHFSADLVEYLIEYCVENGHTSMHYIQKVALAWADSRIATVEQAKEASSFYNKNCYSILNAYGIKGRAPAAPELAYIKKWTEEYGFTLDIVIEACSRTMAKLHQPNFEYTDSILKKWLSSDIHHLADLERLDSAHRQAVSAKKNPSRPIVKNKFNNFEGRAYDYDSLEKQLLSQ